MRIPGIPYVQGRNSYDDGDNAKYAIAIHNTANDATAAQEAAYATRRTDGISAHLYADDIGVIQSLDTDARAGHAGSAEGNSHAVAVEITGTNARSRQWWLERVAWGELGAALAVVVRRYGIAVRRASVAEMRANPRVRAFYGHNDMRLAWGGTTHTDPGSSFPWDRLFSAVTAALTGEDDDLKADERDKLFNIGSALDAALAGLESWRTTGGSTITIKPPATAAQATRVEAALAASAVREAGMRAAVDTLAELVRDGGGDIDTTAILNRIDQRAAEEQQIVQGLTARVAELEAELAEHRRRVALAAQAEATALGELG